MTLLDRMEPLPCLSLVGRHVRILPRFFWIVVQICRIGRYAFPYEYNELNTVIILTLALC